MLTIPSMLMSIASANIIYLSAIALILAYFTAKIASRKGGSYFKWFLAGACLGIVALPLAIIKRQPAELPIFKKCPKCAEQLPISSLVCDGCEYNFLSGMVGTRLKLLPSPDEPSVHDISPRTLAYHA
jgi:hypothetical protein